MNTNNIKTSAKIVLLTIGLGTAWLLNILVWDFRETQDDAVKQNSYYNYAILAQQINTANNTILQDRNHIEFLYNKFLHHQAIGPYNISWLHSSAYAITTFFNPYNPHDWDELLTAVDAVPVNVVLQQAAFYSQNGTSDLAQQGNNLFNTLIDNGDYGLRDAPISATERNANWLEPYGIQYARYYSPIKSVTDYIWILNTSSLYKNFRKLRAARHRKNLSIIEWDSPELLALTKTSLYATDSLYGNAILPTIPYSTI